MLQFGQAGAQKGGMPCTLCPHSGCQHSFLQQGVTPCPECDGGTLVLDPLSGPKWRLDCNKCSFLIYLPDNLHSAKVAEDSLCQVGFEGFCRVLRLCSRSECFECRLLLSLVHLWLGREYDTPDMALDWFV